MLRQRLFASRFLILLFLTALVFAQAGSFASEHSHQNSSQHCCGLCHVGPLPFLNSGFASDFAPELSAAWIAGPLESGSPHEVWIAAGS